MIARTYGKIMFSYVRNCQTVFQSGCAVLHSQQQCSIVPVARSARQDLAFTVPDFGHSHRCVVVSICISLLTYDMDHLLTCLLATCLSIMSPMDCAFFVVSKKASPYPRSPRFTPVLSRFRIRFELIFVKGVRYVCGFIFLHVDVQLFQHHLLKMLFSTLTLCSLYCLSSFVKD